MRNFVLKNAVIMSLLSFIRKGNNKLSNRLGVLVVSLFVMLFVSNIICGYFDMWLGENGYRATAVNTVFQILLGMIVPAYLTAAYSTDTPFRLLHLNCPLRLRHISGIVIVFVLGWFAYNWLISLNESLCLHAQGETVNALLSNYSISGLILNILIIGCLTGFGEELFFRGCLQSILFDKIKRGWVAILLTAIVFTLMHFDMSGIAPLLVQGIFYGYLVYSTGSIWSAVIAHALNNSITVVKIWADHLYSDSHVVSFLDSENLILIISSFVTLLLFFVLYRNRFFTRN